MNHISDVHFWKVNAIERTFHDCEPHRVIFGLRVCSEILKNDSIAHTKFQTNWIGEKKDISDLVKILFETYVPAASTLRH